jgi:hypothetical protein
MHTEIINAYKVSMRNCKKRTCRGRRDNNIEVGL